MEYDDIIVGAGSSGAVLAARLSENADRSVLVLEAGPDYQTVESSPFDILRTWVSMGPHDWGFVAKATSSLEIAYPRGKVTGGSSAVNGHIALRGTPQDFDEWESWGNSEWGFAKILPFYRKLENDRDAHGDFHGNNGPIWIERPQPDTWEPINRAFYSACRAMGYTEVWDHNDPESSGVGPWPRNRRDGIRISTAIGYLGPARHRLNLTVRSHCNVHRVIIDGGRVRGLEVECGGVIQSLKAQRVTLSAGAINSPAILMRSGIGARSALERLGIETVLDLPGVGNNLIDHVMALIHGSPTPGVPHDPEVTNPVGVRYTASGSAEFNDMQLYVLNFYDPAVAPGFADTIPIPTVALAPGLQRPRSRGRITLTSKDPNVPPQIDLNYLDDPEDMRRMIDGVRIAWRLVNSRHLHPYLKEVTNLTEEIVGSDDALADFLRNNCATIYHPVGTARMGPDSDAMAVVDQHCRVKGVEGLRVVDASVMPNIVRANTNLTCIMIGERVAEWMRSEN